MKYYVVEIPHQRPATVWSDDSKRIVDAAAEINAERDEPIIDEVHTLEDAREVLGYDLHNCHILTGSEACDMAETYEGHQRERVVSALEDELED